jgi:signal transduction histidine kinase
VTASLRDVAVFAVHNVATDPPFSRLDLLTCRNVLIYLGPDLQMVERRPVTLRQVVEAAVEAFRPAASGKRVQLDTALGRDPVRVLGDSIRLQQAVGNLLSNALKFTSEGGTIDVRLGRTESHVQLQVRDTGEGIAADLLPHLFERFRQGESSIVRLHSGLGLGLALTRYLVEQHEGDDPRRESRPG